MRALKNRLLERLASSPLTGKESSEKDAIITPDTIGIKESIWIVLGFGLAKTLDKSTVKTGSEALTVCEKDGCITRNE